MLEPALRHVVREVIDVTKREGTETGRERVVPVIVRNAQRALKFDRRLRVLVDRRSSGVIESDFFDKLESALGIEPI